MATDSLQQRVLLSVRSGLRGSLHLLLVGGLQYHCVVLWALSTLIRNAFIAASCHGVVLWFVQHRRVFIDPRASLTEILCHFRTLLPFACSHDFLSLCHARGCLHALNFAARSFPPLDAEFRLRFPLCLLLRCTVC